ncbi:MAG: ATP-binding protein [Planctomycetaceae bacterium]|jgi:hypothetical protein|nr:ATP-binding protein [Planctomycetaceae bacterium]
MSTKKNYKLPYGNSDFRRIRLENYAYVDKTRFIEMLENEVNPNQFFIRPRKFGKSLFFMTLLYYYDINYADQFEQLFGDLYIGQHPTAKKNSYVVMAFDFSGLDTSNEEEFRFSFASNVCNTVRDFLQQHTKIFPDAEKFIEQIDSTPPNIGTLEMAFSVAKKAGLKIFVIIDEYDHFANDLIAMGNLFGKDFYKQVVTANGLVRDFYEKLKAATKSSTVDRTFITGVSPVMLDDLTSGYNIADNLSLKLKYNEMMGFTHQEVEELMNKTGIDANLITINMDYYYNGYLFHKDGKNKVYNPSMILYFFKELLDAGKLPASVVDPNVNTDYNRIKRLTENGHNRDILIKIAKEGSIVAQILPKFSIDQLNNKRYFVSLLFYMGLLTIKESCGEMVRLVVPNYSIQTVYWEYIQELMYSELPDFDTSDLLNVISAMFKEGEIESFIKYVSENILSKLSDHDLQNFDEKYIKLVLMVYLRMSRIYTPMSEYEAVPGRIDLFLQSNPRIPEYQYEWILELKYCKTNASPKEIAQKREEGLEKLNQYLNSDRLKDRPNLKSALIIFIGKNKYKIIKNETTKKPKQSNNKPTRKKSSKK